MKAFEGGNNVKVYNLSAGRSLPDWITARKRRKLANRDVDIRKRIELIQDFTMPDISSCVKISPDGQYIIATGTYKPLMKCYEVCALSQKFERCFDADVVEFEVLSEDYSKIIFLQEERYVEFHNQGGKWFRTRIPCFGRDLAYHYPSCDLYIATSGSDIYRINLEQGKFLSPLKTNASSVNKCIFNPVHYLLTCGTADGCVETWDPRSRHKVGILDCSLSMLEADVQLPAPIYKSTKDLGVTSLAYNDSLTLAVGTQIGRILLYDIRSSKPLGFKDHGDGFPIRDVEFHPRSKMVISMSANAVKVWEKDTFNIHTSLESDVSFNDLCVVPDSGMIFLATEDPKMQIYFLPTLGPAPRWCGHLDALIEELEEEEIGPTYDDYKFVSREDLKQLGLEDLIGSNVLKAAMHGFYMDVRLYNKAKMISQSTQFEDALKIKVKQKVSEQNERKMLAKEQKMKEQLVNSELVLKLDKDAKLGRNDTKNTAKAILADDRFQGLFKSQDFDISKDTVMFGLTQPLTESKLNAVGSDDDDEEEEDKRFKSNTLATKKQQNDYIDMESDGDSIIDEKERESVEADDSEGDDDDASEAEVGEEESEDVEDDSELEGSTGDVSEAEGDDEGSEDEEVIVENVNKKSRQPRNSPKRSKIGKLVGADHVSELKDDANQHAQLSLAERIEMMKNENNVTIRDGECGSKEADFSFGQPSLMQRIKEKNENHQKYRKNVIRSAKSLRGGKAKFSKPF